MANFRITDLKPGMNTQNELYILWSCDIKKASNGKLYLDMYFRDSTGEINGKKWETSQNEYDLLQTSKLYYVNGRISEYLGSLQLTVLNMRLAPESIQNTISKYVQSAPFSAEDMLKKVYDYINAIEDKELHDLCKLVYDENKSAVSYYPAAKALHHSIMGGYLYHITTMLDLAKAMSTVYSNVNTDFLYSGVLLHDIMKLKELNSNEFGIAEYSDEGQLLGHIEMGICYLGEMGKRVNLSSNKETLLKHMILSHHYIPEHGSTKMPMFIEAELLHHIDKIDSRVYDFNKAYESLEKGQISEKFIFSLDRRVLLPDFEK